MLTRTIWVVVMGILTSDQAWAKPPHSAEAVDRQGRAIERLRGEGEVEARLQDDGATFYYSGVHRVTTPLPDGYPPPTPPGAIEIKTYPGARRATFTGRGQGPDGMRNANAAFWPLFAHIKSRGIEMTAPVEIEYEGLEAAGEGNVERWTMSFLYRNRDLGTKESYGSIQVEDTEPATVFAAGLAGDATRQAIDEALQELEGTIRDSDRWQRKGDPRIMGYNGPDVPQKERWSEVQIPVVRIENQ